MHPDFKTIRLRNLKVAHVGPVRLELLAALDAADGVVLEIETGAPVDIAGVQLIESARKYAEQHGKRLRLAAPPHQPLADLLDATGFLEASTSTRTFWTAGEQTR